MNAPFKPDTMKIPDVLMSGEAIGHMLTICNNAIIFAKTQDGTMRPFIDPTPIMDILKAALQSTVDENKSE